MRWLSRTANTAGWGSLWNSRSRCWSMRPNLAPGVEEGDALPVTIHATEAKRPQPRGISCLRDDARIP
jgi:hypothetical protein